VLGSYVGNGAFTVSDLLVSANGPHAKIQVRPAPPLPFVRDMTDQVFGEPDRVKWVDALRGFAAFAVAWFHLYTDQSAIIPLPQFVNHIAVLGRWGVELFFAISGFVLATTLIPRRDMTGLGDIGLYLARRSVRLDITFWAVLALYVVAQGWLAPRPYAPGPEFNRIVDSAFYFLPLGLFHGNANYIPTAWSLAIEVQFYLMFATMVVAINWLTRVGVGRGMAAVAMVALMTLASAPHQLGITKVDVGFWMYPHLITFAVGAAAALVHQRIRGSGWVFVLAMVLAAYGAATEGGRSLATFGAGGIFATIIWVKPLQRILADQRLLYLGALSYCLYLLHPLAGALVLDDIRAQFPAPSIMHFAGVVAAMVASLAASAVVFHLIERPSIALSKRIGRPRSTQLERRSRLPCKKGVEEPAG